ncbi:unnamed protein product [Larinioides sclopetarius]|uniref:Transmembrane protein n=1 Tax=Larinioides sclopetarius TaxID=280406 RepID=A0AAV2B853_9ARAC
MSFLCSSSDEALSSEFFQSSSNTSGNAQSDVARTEKPEEFGTILNLSRAFWNLPADDSTKAKNEETVSSFRGHDINKIPQSDWTLSLFHPNTVQRRLYGNPILERQTKPVISKTLEIRNLLCEHLLLILVTLVPSSAIVVGAQYVGHCPANWLIPHLVLLIGVLSTIFMIYLLLNLCREYFTTSGGQDMSTVGKICGWLLGIFLIIEITLFFDMPASFDTFSRNYCSRSFYLYAAFFNIYNIASFFLGGLVKLIRLAGHVNHPLPFPEDELGF